MKVGDLFIALGFQVDEKTLKEFNENIKTGTLALGSMSAAAAATVYAVNRFTSGSVDSAVKLKNLTDQTGVASEEVQRFYNVAGRLNTEVTLEGTIDAFRQLSDVIADAKLGKGPIGEAGMLGLSNIGQMNPMQIIKQLRENFKNNVGAWGQGDERVVQNLMKSLGLGPEFIQAIKATDAEFNQLYNNPIINGDAQAKLEDLARSYKEVNIQWDLFKANASAKLSPIIIDFLTNLNTVLEKTADLTGKASDKFDEFQKKHDPEGTITRNVGNATALGLGARLVKSPNPWLKGVGGAILLGTGIEDVGNYMRGKPSSTGDAVRIGKRIYHSVHGIISEEMMKTEQQQIEDRQRILHEQPLEGKGVGRLQPHAFNQNNTVNVYSSADSRGVAMEVIDHLNRLAYRETAYSMGLTASGNVG